MTNEEAPVAQTFLRLKAKAAKGRPWSTGERATVELSLKKEGDISVLAGCCLLVSQRSEQHGRSLEIIRKAIERGNPSLYVELSIYEALIYVEVEKLAPFLDAVFSFIEQSLTRRAVNLDNAIFLLGRLGRGGENRALVLLRSLAHDKNSQVRDSASRVLRGLERD